MKDVRKKLCLGEGRLVIWLRGRTSRRGDGYEFATSGVVAEEIGSQAGDGRRVHPVPEN